MEAVPNNKQPSTPWAILTTLSTPSEQQDLEGTTATKHGTLKLLLYSVCPS